MRHRLNPVDWFGGAPDEQPMQSLPNSHLAHRFGFLNGNLIHVLKTVELNFATHPIHRQHSIMI
jgi:hypothetical protein